jgi:hypothetical protein
LKEIRQMAKVNELERHLRPGAVYRRSDLAKWSRSVDRHLSALVKEGVLRKVSPGLYHASKPTIFGAAPASEKDLVQAFLKDERFLILTPNAYNSLGLGTTQLHNKRVVYNHKRHGDFTLGGRRFAFQVKPHFPKKLSAEFLLVDIVGNLDQLADDQPDMLGRITAKVGEMDKRSLSQALSKYGNARAKKILAPLLQNPNAATGHGLPISA